MKATRPYTVFAFSSTHDALDAEALLDDMGIDVVPIPTPKNLSAQCGIALRVPEGQGDRAREYIERAGILLNTIIGIDDI